MNERPRQVRSDPPVEDLKRERDAFIQQFFRRGAQISEELLGEMSKLREQVQLLEEENARLKTHIASDDAIKQLLHKIEQLEREKDEILAKTSRTVTATNDEEFASRVNQMENELADLGTLHVAGMQLHTGTTVRRAVRNIKELCAQFLGGAQFVIYIATDDGSSLVPIAIEGLTQKEARQFSVDDGVVFASYANNTVTMSDRDPSTGSIDAPSCVIPISMSNRTMGCIAIFKTLPQKTSFSNVDHELFKLLAAQAAPALVNARLFTDAGRRIPGAQAFIDQED